MPAGRVAPALGGSAACVRTGHAPSEDAAAAFSQIAEQIGKDGLCLIVLFVSPDSDLAEIVEQCQACFGATPVIGCTTAGEISPAGYATEEIVAVGFPSSHFCAATLLIDDLENLEKSDLAGDLVDLRLDLASVSHGWETEFAFLMVDGLSLLEDQLVSFLSVSLGSTPLFGGSAGDGLDFRKTFVLHEGALHRNAAVLSLFRTKCEVEVFTFDHLVPTDRKMVVTEADPDRRVVREINAETAAREYARLVGKDPEQLSPFIFAAHPVVVKVGGEHHVRAIQKVEPNGDLTFFAAIDEGLVLTVAEPKDMETHLEEALASLEKPGRGRPETIIACDCILRRLEAEQKQAVRGLSRVLSENRVIGFSTYGEQANSVHVNQTMTGAAIYAPEDEQ